MFVVVGCSCLCLCLCVWNIWRDVKLLTCSWLVFAWGSNLSLVFNLISNKGFQSEFQQRGSARLTVTAQRRHCQFVVIQSLISCVYLRQFVSFIIYLNGNRPSQVPACRFSNNFSNQTWILLVWFSQSNCAASEPVGPLNKDKERHPSTNSHVESSNFLLSSLLKCFCTYDAFHINNSIRCFWASVIHAGFVKVAWTPRGKPFQAKDWHVETTSELTLLNW